MWCQALVYKGTQRFGAFLLSGCLVWCFGLVLGWPSWELHSSPRPHPPPPSRPRAGAHAWSSRPHKESPHDEALEKPCFGFYHSALGGKLFISACCSSVALFSLALKGVSVSVCQFLLSIPVSSVPPPMTRALRSHCSKMGWVESSKISTKLLIFSYQTAFSFLTSCLHEVCSLYGYFLHSLCHTHRSNLLIGAIKSWGCNKRINKLPHNLRKCSDKCWLGYVGVPSTSIKLWKQPCYL